MYLVCSSSGHGYWLSMVGMMLSMDSCPVDVRVLRKLGLPVRVSRVSILLVFSCLISLSFSSLADRLRSFSLSRVSRVSLARVSLSLASGVVSNCSVVGRASVGGSTSLAACHAASGASGHAAIISFSFFFILRAIGDPGAMDPACSFMSELIGAGSSAEPGPIQL